MSFAPYTPNPKAISCAEKVGLPSWYTQDPMLPRPQVMLDPEKERAFRECMQSSSNANNTFSQLKNTSPERKLLYGVLAVLAVLGILKATKVI